MPTLRFLPEQTDVFIAFRAAATNAAETARLLGDLVMGQEPPDQAVPRLRELEQRGDEITHEIFTALTRNSLCRRLRVPETLSRCTRKPKARLPARVLGVVILGP
jgi:hypothetical protein